MLELFETRTMIEALEQMLPPSSFLKRNFFSRVRQFDSEHIDIDIVKGKRRLGAYVNPKAEGKLVDRIGFKSHSYKPPYVKMKMTTTAQDFLKKQAGQTVYTPSQSAMARAEQQLGQDLAELDQMITRMEEKQAADLLSTGILAITGEGVDLTIDFLMPASHKITLAGGDLWSAGTSNPLQDLREWRRLVRKDSGLVPTDVIMGESALDAFLANTAVTDQLDNRRIDLGNIDPQTLPEGAILYGRIKDVNVTLWSYDEWYLDESGTEQPMIDPKEVLMVTRNARTSTNYGAIEDVEANASVARFAKSWTTKDPSARWLLVQSAPMLALHQSDAFLKAQVLA
ncbi:MAG: major capsid protein [Salinimicrobium sediminis]|nr:major capsid protein [Salinimicrobium sediminis]